MKVSFNWLKDYVDIKVSPEVLADKLTMAGLEVGGCYQENNDTVFEIEITANRPDCLSMLGVAQEAAAVLGKKFTPHSRTGNIRKNFKKDSPYVSMGRKMKKDFIHIQDKKDCAFYRGCLIKDVKVALSPEWLRQRIEALGVRPINNIVDITNYCLLEFGQPLHAFDYNKIKEQIIVRRAKHAEKILTIDEKERVLDENILVISDKNKAVAIAGIMGDKLSEVDASTRDVLLESAYFNPVLIRRASRQLGLSTDSSYRFERQVDWQRVRDAQDKAVDLICKIAGGKFIDEKEAGKEMKPKPVKIQFDCARANKLLSLDIGVDKVRRIFASLGFSCAKSSKGKLLVKIAPIRRDIKIQEDLMEELSRIYGYEKVVSTLPAIRSALLENPQAEGVKPGVRRILCGLGFNETINYSLLSKQMLDKAMINKDSLRLRNPLSSEQECLRPVLSSGLLNCLAYNISHRNTDLKFFELGHVFNSDAGEELSLGIIATGKHIDTWQVKKEFDFFSLKGVVQGLIENLNFETPQFLPNDENGMFYQGESAKIYCQNKEVGSQGRIDNRILLNFGIKNAGPVFYAEIFMERLCAYKSKPVKFTALPVYPSVLRDISLVVNKSVEYADIEELIKKEALSHLKAIKLVDVYKGEQIAAGCVGMTISLEFGLADRTLTDDEVTQARDRIVKKLKQELSIQIR
ncbi:MAG: phenylalanine--tRNA ligase subunit beta [Candidatus Omnitrophica bacterium]|nr:phenylalanine--tRNA ligase subunit beta [Candidatus Omnitrophota bacterium]